MTNENTDTAARAIADAETIAQLKDDLIGQREAWKAENARLATDRDGWRSQYEAVQREAQASFDAQREIEEAWDAIGTRGNKMALSLPEQLSSLMRELDAALHPAPVANDGETE